MSESSGKYPLAIVTPPAVLRQLSDCPEAIKHMRTAHLTDGGAPCEFILYLGMWLLSPPGTESIRLLDDLPTGSNGNKLRLCSSLHSGQGRG